MIFSGMFSLYLQWNYRVFYLRRKEFEKWKFDHSIILFGISIILCITLLRYV